MYPLSSRINDASAIFDGVVDQVGPPLNGQVKVVFRSVNAYKGQASVVMTADNPATCGYAFNAGERYLVFAQLGLDQSFRTGLCSGTQPYVYAAKNISALEQFLASLRPVPALTLGAVFFLVLALSLASLRALGLKLRRDPFSPVK